MPVLMKFATALSFLLAWAASCAAITIETVPVGNPGNVAESRWRDGWGFVQTVGSVDHDYRIGKYEVTAGQYTAFLNAVAKADPNGLYSPDMVHIPPLGEGSNIMRTGSSPNYSYSIATDWANRP